jgi:parallel beta-helix repeat protein
MILSLAVIITAILTTSESNGNQVIDFEESFSDYQNIHGLNLGGVTLTCPDTGIVEICDNRCGAAYHSPTKSILTDSSCTGAIYPLVGVFDGPAKYICLWGGDEGGPEGDMDSWELEAFDAPVGGNSLRKVSSGEWNGFPYWKLEINEPNIRRFEARWTGTALPISYDDLEFFLPLSLYKNDDINDDNCVRAGHKITYRISYNYQGVEDDNFIIVDYLPEEVDYNSSTPPGDYNATDRTVIWDLGTMTSPTTGSVDLNVIVKDYNHTDYVITNVAEIIGNTFSASAEVNTAVCFTGSIGDNIICVDKDAVGGLNDGTSWDDAFLDFNDGLAKARYVLQTEPNCEIWVAAGAYKPPYESGYYQNSTFRIPEGNIAIRGHFGGIGRYETSPDQRDFNNPIFETFFDGNLAPWEKAYYVVTCDDIGDGLLLDGFTITGSLGDYYGPPGAGLLITNYSDPMIVRCKFIDNHRYGIYVSDYSYPDVADCLFIDNKAAGIYSYYSWPYVKNCVIDGNNANFYGMKGSYSEMLVEDCIIRRQGDSGISFSDSPHLAVIDCKIENNALNGINCSDSYLEVMGCTIQNNANNGIMVTSYSTPKITNNIIRGNKGNGIYITDCGYIEIKNNWIYKNGDSGTDSGMFLQNSISPPLVRNNTIVENPYGVFVALGQDPCLVNDIIWGNSTNIYSERGLENIEASYNCIEGGFPGTGNISSDPCFVKPDSNDFHLKPASLCIDSGDANADYGDETDIDGQCRVIWGNSAERADIGADEFATKADYTGDSLINFIDFANLATKWLLTDPNKSLDDDNDVDIYDLAQFCDDWLWIGPCVPLDEMLAQQSGGDLGMALETEESTELADQTQTTETVEEPATETPAAAEEQMEGIAQPLSDEQILVLIDWAEQIWETDPEVREMIDPNDYQRFIDSIREELND